MNVVSGCVKMPAREGNRLRQKKKILKREVGMEMTAKGELQGGDGEGGEISHFSLACADSIQFAPSYPFSALPLHFISGISMYRTLMTDCVTIRSLLTCSDELNIRMLTRRHDDDAAGQIARFDCFSVYVYVLLKGYSE